MKIIGLTGPSGSGKTTVSAVAESLGFFVIDCDKVSKEVSKNPLILKELENAFGGVVINGQLDRKALAQKAFSSPENTKKLNSIMLPKIVLEIESIIKSQGDKNILLDAPTLFESGLNTKCDAVIAVLADEELRRKRLTARDNLTKAQLESRLSAAKPNLYYTEKTDYIIYNNEDIKSAEQKALEMLRSFCYGK